MAEESPNTEQRKYERFMVEIPVSFNIGGVNLAGVTVNAGDEGMLAEFYLSPKDALTIFKILNKKPNYRLEVEYIYEEEHYIREAEITHFQLIFLGNEPYRFKVGFLIPKKEIEAS